jgi:hypothetical protein
MINRVIKILPILLVLASCSLFQTEADTVIDLLPRDTDVPGWIRTDSYADYRIRDIIKYNRDYENTGIEKLAYCVYKSLDNPEIEIKLEILKFENVLDAYGFFSINRGPGIFEISGMNEYYTNTLAIIQMGEYVLFAMTYKTGSLLKNDLKTFVNIPVIYIGKNYNQENIASKTNILKNADGYGILYSRKPYHRIPFLNNIYFTHWIWNKNLTEVFLSDRESFYNAYELFKKHTETGYTVMSSNDTYIAFKKEPDNTYSFISVNDRWISGCWSVKKIEDGKKILGEILSKIQDYKKNKLGINPSAGIIPDNPVMSS